MCSGSCQPVAAAAGASGHHQCVPERLHSHFFLSHGVKSICQKPFARPAHSLGSSWASLPLTREDRPNEATAAPLQRFTLPCYYCQVLSAQAKIGMMKHRFFFLFSRQDPAGTGLSGSSRQPERRELPEEDQTAQEVRYERLC